MQNTIREEFQVDEVLDRFGGRQKFSGFVDFLMESNERVNLVSRETSPEALYGMVADCLVPLCMSETSNLFTDRTWMRILDIGTGGGLPALPLAIALGNVELTLIERTGKKAMYLRRALQKLGIKGQVLNCDFREFVDNPTIQTMTGELPPIPAGNKPEFEVVTIRWVKADSAMIRRAAGLLMAKPERSGLVYYSTTEELAKIKSSSLIISPHTYGFSQSEATTSDSLQERTITVFAKGQ